MTTRRPAILEDMGPSQIRRIDLDLPSTAEALDLLEAVSGSEVTYTSGATALVQLCGNLPLAVSSVAILIRGSRVSAPMPAAAVVDLLSHGFLTLNDVGSTANPHNDSFRTFDRSFCIFGQIARSLRTCFASYCCCFATEHEIRPLVPRGAVECLFDAILSGHGGYLDKGDRMLLSVQDDDQPFASAEIIDKLVSIGLVDVITAEGYTSPEGSDLCIHHDLQYDFGVQTAVALERLLWKNKARHATTEQLKKYAMIRANDVLLRGYKDDRAASPGPSHTRSLDSDWDVIVGEHRLYMLKHLFRHVMRANRKAKARKLTSSSMFIFFFSTLSFTAIWDPKQASGEQVRGGKCGEADGEASRRRIAWRAGAAQEKMQARVQARAGACASASATARACTRGAAGAAQHGRDRPLHLLVLLQRRAELLLLLPKLPADFGEEHTHGVGG